MSKNRRLILWGAAGVFFVGVLAFCIYTWPPRDRFETYDLPIEIRSHRFVFQRNFVWRYKQEGKGSDFVRIHMLLPGYEPATPENYKRFIDNMPAVNLVIFESKNSNNRLSSDKFQPSLEKEFDRLLQIYCDSGGTLSKEQRGDDDFEVRDCGRSGRLFTTKSREFFIMCDHKGQWPNPQCKNIGNTFDLYGDLNLAFHFDEIHSSKIVEIFRFVRNFIETAKSKGES